MKTNFGRNVDGASAVEFALITPLFIILLGFALNLGVILANRNAAQSMAFAAIAAGADVIHRGGTATAAATKAQQVIDANAGAGVLIFGATFTAVPVATVLPGSGGSISIKLSVDSPMPFPAFGFPPTYSFQIQANG